MRQLQILSLPVMILLASCAPGTLPTPTSTLALSSTTAPPTLTYAPYQSVVSPNGEYVANVYASNASSSGKQVIEIADSSGQVLSQVLYQKGKRLAEMRILRWSNDSARLYFYDELLPDGGGGQFWWTGLNLEAIDVQSGHIESLLSGDEFVSFAISPDEKYLAYAPREVTTSTVYVRDLANDHEESANILNGESQFYAVGNIYWAPSSDALVFETQDSSSILQTIYLDTQKMRQKIVFADVPYPTKLQGWSHDGRLEFVLYGLTADQIVQVDVQTGKSIVIGTTTPNP